MAQIIQPRSSAKVSGRMPLVLITLKRTPERTAKALRRLEALGLSPEILWATDGADPEVAATLPRDPIGASRARMPMQPGEVGLCMSWWRVAAMVVRNNWPKAIALEDDAESIGKISELFNALDELPANFDFALLHPQSTPSPELARGGHTRSFRRVIHCSYTTVALCMSNAGARKMLSGMVPFARPIDVWMRDNLDNILTVYQPQEGLGWFRQDQWGPSTCRVSEHRIGQIPKVIHRIWVGGSPMPDEFQGYWRRWGELHPGWKRRTWDDEMIDAEWPGHPVLAKCTMPAAKSDIARLLILQKHGGLYIDTDFEPLKCFAPLMDASSIVIANMHAGVPCNGFMASVAGHALLEMFVKAALNGKGSILDSAGPGMIKRVMDESGFLHGWPKPLMDKQRTVANTISDTGITLVEPWVLFPYYWTDERPKRFGHAWAAHHWARSWWGEKEWRLFRHYQETAQKAKGLPPEPPTARTPLLQRLRLKKLGHPSMIIAGSWSPSALP